MMEVVYEYEDEIRITAKAQEVLLAQSIDEHHPGTILKDFETLLEFVGEGGLPTTSKYYFIPQRGLDELNARMSRPVQHRLKRPQQKSFPNLHGLFLILRASGLGVGQGSPPACRLTIDPEVLSVWRGLNATERYFNLLESWLVQSSPDMIAERSRGQTSECCRELTDVALKLGRQTGKQIQCNDGRFGLLYGTMEFLTVALSEMFGWMQLEYTRPEKEGSVRLATIELNDFGQAMIEAAAAAYNSLMLYRYHDDQLPEPGLLLPVLQRFFPQWQRTLSPPKLPFRDGTFTWRVSLGRMWRRIVAPADSTLDELAVTILHAVDFDMDHLYCFELRDRLARKCRIACGYENTPVCTVDVRLGDLPLLEGEKMAFLFDYGDNWQFDVKLESIDPKKSKFREPLVTAEKGKSPRQYRWDDE